MRSASVDDGAMAWSELGRELVAFLARPSAELSYEFDDMTFEIPRDETPGAARVVWKVDGTIRVSSGPRPVAS
ncbi:hypothetical protein [Nocardioides stalactiti]|uniref:hypothetical protein n=1 Tax=Nocardioides stalactiti TaxID=2755356 RepID=UPI0016031FA1|nr:hypothetical protein [Nocardioides stalactiti]